jgi:hypothetical protein
MKGGGIGAAANQIVVFVWKTPKGFKTLSGLSWQQFGLQHLKPLYKVNTTNCPESI